ncbi:TniQ family protein [Pseudomonas putida]|uniref:TniQ family protein n=1 Tax=Pseudomonas putida TaxID=303 RepID=UPI003AF13FAB
MVPMHPQPRVGEIFSSWLVRLSLANGLPLHSFYSGLLRYRQAIWNRDIDRHPPISFLECLNHATKVPISQLNELTLVRYEGLFYDELSATGVVPWLLPLGIYHRTHKLAGMQFCPLCLKEDSNPYYRLKWRVGLIVLCDVHNCVLVDRCPKCNSPVIFHRHGIGRGKYLHPNCLKYCYSCNHNLSTVEPTYPDWPDLGSQSLLERLIREFEFCPWQGFPVGADCPIPGGFRS